MIPAIIDISEYTQEMSFTQDEINSFSRYTLGNVAYEYMQIWEQLVDRDLKGTRQQYKSGMSFDFIDDYNVVFKLEGGKGDAALGLMIEEGASPWDQKPYFEKSKKKKQSQSGTWYMHIPMRMATSEALGDSGIFSGKLEKPIQNLIKKQPVNIATGFSVGLTKSQLPEGYQGLTKKPQLQGMTNTYTHKSPKFEGVMKGSKESHGQYMKFRTVSESSDENAWFHPGFKAHKFMNKALDIINTDAIFERSKKEFLKQE